MDDIAAICGRIRPVDSRVFQEAQRLLDIKTKPRRSLGRLEDLACRIAAMRDTPRPTAGKKAVIVMAADHGVADEGVSAYPSEVTRQMLRNFARGGAAINVLSRYVDADLVVVDMGVKEPLEDGCGIRVHRMGPGTRNFCHGPAMTRDEAVQALRTAIRITDELATGGVILIGLGDIGIANTTSSSALAACFMRVAPEEVTGTGTGIDDKTLRRKIDVVRRGIARNEPNVDDSIDVLAKLGGFEIAGLTGVIIGAAAHRIPVIMDGFVTSTAALAAIRLAPNAKDYLVASHQSPEPGHGVLLRTLGLRPLFDLELRLGEGTGAALAMSIVDAALHVLQEMATFETAGVTDTGA